jgi:hypothetical protein
MSEKTLPLRGQRITVRCLRPPVTNRAEQITMWNQGDEASVVVTGFWEGLIERGDVAVCEPVHQATPAVPTVSKGHKPGCRCPICKRKG